MKNYTKQQSGIFCSGQTFTIGSQSHGLIPNELDHLHIAGTSGLIPRIIEFKHIKTSINCLENDIQNEE